MLTRPVIIVSAPRSGSTLFFETLARSPDLWSVGGESHAVIEGIPWLHPRSRAWESNRLGRADADARTVRLLRRRFSAVVRDRDGRRAPPGRHPVRLLEKTPRNALRIPFLQRVFPGATFVYLHREPAETMSSMLDGWRSGRHVSYPALPGRAGEPWSFLLVPGWRDLSTHDLPGTVAHQWSSTVASLLDGLADVPDAQRCAVRYRDLVEDPSRVIAEVCEALELRWDRPFSGPMPLSSTTLDAPVPGKWRRNAAEIEPALEATAAVAARAEAVAMELALDVGGGLPRQ